MSISIGSVESEVTLLEIKDLGNGVDVTLTELLLNEGVGVEKTTRVRRDDLEMEEMSAIDVEAVSSTTAEELLLRGETALSLDLRIGNGFVSSANCTLGDGLLGTTTGHTIDPFSPSTGLISLTSIERLGVVFFGEVEPDRFCSTLSFAGLSILLLEGDFLISVGGVGGITLIIMDLLFVALLARSI